MLAGADLRELIKPRPAPYAGDDHVHGVLSGDRVILPADIATPFGVVEHDLATNAEKYAALSGHIARVGLTLVRRWGERRPCAQGCLDRGQWTAGSPTAQAGL